MRKCKFVNAVKLDIDFYDGGNSCQIVERDDAIEYAQYYIGCLMASSMSSIKRIRIISGSHVRFEFRSNLFHHVNY